MPFDRFMIAPFTTGLETDLRPWLIPDDAFQTLENSYVFRGRIRKRVGEELTGVGWPNRVLAPYFSRLAYFLKNTMSGSASGTVPGHIFKIGQSFTVDTCIFTVFQASGAMLAVDTAGILTPSGTFDTTTGAYTITGTSASVTPVYFYLSEPVMGITQFLRGVINTHVTYAFDTQFAYFFNGNFWQQTGIAVWHGDSEDYFWITNWFTGVGTAKVISLFVTNFFVTNPNGSPTADDDPIWIFDGTNWMTYTPEVLNSGQLVQTARIILPFKNCLLLLNTIELNADGTKYTNFINRCRFSALGEDPLDVAAFLETPSQTGSIGGGFLDAATEEEIISAEFIKDRLIVFFERSTWEIVYTGNGIQPFVWQKINTELGAESTFSSVPFDKEILTIGQTGVHSCNGANVERIDVKIPDLVFEIIDKQTGVQRVAGIRDYDAELVYWTFPAFDQVPNESFNTKILVFNYRNRTWAIFDDCITTWGYFEQQPGVTWANQETQWEQANMAWASGDIQTQFRQVVGGNPEGFIFLFDADYNANAPVMQITNMAYNATNKQLTLTIIDHTMSPNDYIEITNAQGVVLGGTGIYNIVSVIPPNTVVISVPSFSGTYTGGGMATRVSQIFILSKQWNPYDKDGRNVYLSKIDFAVQSTSAGQVLVEYFPSASGVDMVQSGSQTGTIMGTGILETSPYDPDFYPLEQSQERLWHPVYFQTTGECIQILITLNEEQITTPEIAFSGLQIEAMILHTSPTSSRLQ